MTSNYQYNLGQLFEEVVQNNEARIAIQFMDGNKLCYNDLNVLSNKIAHFLISKNIKQNDVVVILNNKSTLSYAIMLACLKVGVIYTNLDPKSPLERFSKMIDVCEPGMLFYFQDELSVVNEYSSKAFESLEYTCYDFQKELSKYDETVPERHKVVNSNSPAYIMFTSGSTGFPKGVVISHGNIINFIKWTKYTYSTTVNDVFTNINPMHFDNSVFDFYASLFTGASIIPVNESQTRNPKRLIEALNKVLPTIWFSVPSMLVFILNMRALKSEDLPTLRVVTFGGEGFPKNQLRSLWKFWGERVSFVNVYGPTECTCICSSYVVTSRDLENDNLLPLGPIAPNFSASIRDEKGELVAPGEIGELYIGGPNVALGYYNNPEKTEAVFVIAPSQNAYKEILYNSGDLVKEAVENNVLLFCGRKDNQIKRMGYRIELEEIENACNTIDFIKESAVIYVDNEQHKSKIYACLRSENKDEAKINESLTNYLPSYMMPDGYFYFDNLPKNQNGKINRLILKEAFNK
jgi:D-alanine--poly(phosphoribitol) ligase subunit 1